MSRRTPVVAYVALGANLGDPAAQVRWAMDRLDEIEAAPSPSVDGGACDSGSPSVAGQAAGIGVIARSRLWQSAPQGASGPDFVNAVVALRTRLSAPALLGALQAIEARAGRERPYPNAPRTLDLDLLLYGDARIDSPSLTVPHPRMAARAFVLRPLAEVAPERVSAADLAAVAAQRIAPLHDAGSAGAESTRCSHCDISRAASTSYSK